MIRKLLWSICFVLLSDSVFAADDKPKWDRTSLPGIKNQMLCHPGDPTMCVLRLEVGEVAPWTGIMQTEKQAAKNAVRADPLEIQRRVDEAVETATQLARNDLELEREKRRISDEAWAKKMAAQEDSFKKQLEVVTPSWYESPAFVATVTVVLTLGAVAATVAVADKLAN